MKTDFARRLWERLYSHEQARYWQDYAEWTIPSVCSKQKELRYDYQSIGAQLVHSLSSRLAQTLFPPNNSFFKLVADDPSIESALADIELQSSMQLFQNASYAQLTYALQSLIITGNALLERTPAGIFNVYGALEYVVDRDLHGNARAIVLRQSAKEEDLSPFARQRLELADKSYRQMLDSPMGKTFELYTVVYWDEAEQLWLQEQYINDVAVHEQQGKYPKNLCPFLPVRWSTRTGEWFGRGYVETYAGDFIRLSELSYALAQYENASTNVKLLVSPSSMVDVQELNNPTEGLAVLGDPAGVQALEFGQYQKIQALQANIQAIQQRLSIAFMQGTNQRQGERVTAFEVQMLAQEAESTLGGVYSLLSQSLHLPLAYLLCYEIDADLGLQVAAGALDVQIITGMQALSRSSELQQWVQLTQELGLIVPTLKQVSPRFNTEKIIERFMLAHGISREFLYTEEELQVIMQQQLQQIENTQYQDRNITSQDATNEAVESLGVI